MKNFLKIEPKTFGYDRDAFLLDLDGTLLDIAPTPDAVKVEPGLLDDLRTLRDRCGGALAIVTGRSLREVAALLGDTPTAVAAEHGTALRHAPSEPPVGSGTQAPRFRAALPRRAAGRRHDRAFITKTS